MYILGWELVISYAVADPGGDPHGAKEPPIGLDLVLRSTDMIG